jgi:putative aminopeptidase FrvX
MTSKKITIILVFLFAAVTTFYAQTTPVEKGLAAITKEAVQSQLEFLSSDWMEGREASTRGEFMAGDYIASIFKLYGLKPAGDEVQRPMGRRQSGPPSGAPGQMPSIPTEKTYFQGIPFIEAEAGSIEQTMALIIKEGAVEKKIYFSGSDFSLTASGAGIEFTAPLVFVGYGFKNTELGYDDFKGIDVKGKIIVRIAGVPGQNDPESEIYKKLGLGDFRNAMMLSRSKNETAEKLGAVGVIEIASTLSQAGRMNPMGRRGGVQYANYPFRYASPFYEGDKPLVAGSHRLSLPEDSLRIGIVTLNLSPKVTAELMKNSGINIEGYEKNPKMKIAKELKGKSIYVKSTSKNMTVLGRNVVAMIEGENPNEVIVVGGHYDHMGIKNGYIWNGADDNASGTVGVMTIAKAIMATGVKPKRTIIFAAWTGEEKGLLGSQYFVNKFKNVENIKLNLNYDMISRNDATDTEGVNAGVTYTENWPVLKTVVEKANKEYNLGLKLSMRGALHPSGGSDFSSFSAKNIPIYAFMAAMHDDYHNPTDTVDKVDIKKMTNIIKIGYLAVWELANMDKIEPAK